MSVSFNNFRFLIPIIFLILEFLVLKLMPDFLWVPCAVLLVLLVVLVFLKKRNSFNLLGYISNVLTAKGGGTLYSILMIIYVILQIGFIENYFMDYIKKTHDFTIWHIGLAFSFLFLPFIFQLIFQPNIKRKDEERKVLITALSLLKFIDEKKYAWEDARPYFKENVHTFWGTWDPVRQLLNKYKKLEVIYVLITKEVEAQLQELTQILGENPLEYYIKHNKLKARVELIKLANFDDLEVIQKGIEYNIFDNKEFKSNNYQDKHLLFNLTTATSTVSVALAIKAIKGSRGAVVFTQDEGKKLKAINLTAMSVKELFEEIYERF